jgi:hypothetical protein
MKLQWQAANDLGQSVKISLKELIKIYIYTVGQLRMV